MKTKLSINERSSKVRAEVHHTRVCYTLRTSVMAATLHATEAAHSICPILSTRPAEHTAIGHRTVMAYACSRRVGLSERLFLCISHWHGTTPLSVQGVCACVCVCVLRTCASVARKPGASDRSLRCPQTQQQRGAGITEDTVNACPRDMSDRIDHLVSRVPLPKPTEVAQHERCKSAKRVYFVAAFEASIVVLKKERKK